MLRGCGRRTVGGCSWRRMWEEEEDVEGGGGRRRWGDDSGRMAVGG